MEFLLSLGWPLSVTQHSGWNGNIKTSWRGLNISKEKSQNNSTKESPKAVSGNGESVTECHGGSLFNGETHILHWADVTSEIAFLVPTRKSEIGMTKAVWNVAGERCLNFILSAAAYAAL